MRRSSVAEPHLLKRSRRMEEDRGGGGEDSRPRRRPKCELRLRGGQTASTKYTLNTHFDIPGIPFRTGPNSKIVFYICF